MVISCFAPSPTALRHFDSLVAAIITEGVAQSFTRRLNPDFPLGDFAST